MNNRPLLLSVLLAAAILAGCEQLGIETPDKVAARQEAEGKAIGGGCRHSGRPLEDCYELNRRFPRAAIYAGWREMDGYMRDNNIASVKPESAEEPAVPDVAPKAASAEPEKKAATEVAAKPAEGEKKAAGVVTKPALEKPLGGVAADKMSKVAAARIS